MATRTGAKAAPRGTEQNEVKKVGTILLVPIGSIRRDEKQPRQYFDEDSMEETRESLKADGQDKSIDVIEVSGDPDHRYQIVDGERRWRSLQAAGKTHAEVRVLPSLGTKEIFRRQIRANGVEPLTMLEMARAFQRGVTEFGMTHADLARDQKCSVGKVGQYLSLMKLHSMILRRLEPSTPEGDRLPLMMAVALAQVEDRNQQLLIFGKITKGNTIAMTTDEVRTLVADFLDRKHRTTAAGKAGKQRVRLGRPLEEPKDFRLHLMGLADRLPRQLSTTYNAMPKVQAEFNRLFKDATAFDLERMINGFENAVGFVDVLLGSLVAAYTAKGGKAEKIAKTTKRIAYRSS